MRPDEQFHLDRIEVAHRDHSHEIGSIPIGVELLETVVRERPNDLWLADWQPVGVTRILEQDRQLCVQHPGAGSESGSPFLQDDAALFVDLFRIERDSVRPFLQDEQRAIDHGWIVGRNLQLVDRLVEARVGVDVRAETHARGLQKPDDVLLRKTARAVEAHVLNEVSETALIIVFENRSCVDDQPKLRAILRSLVGPDVISQAVGERTHGNPRVDGNHCREWGVLRAGGDGALSRRHGAGRRDHQRQKHQPCLDARDHDGYHFTTA
jgi:hypothetical protein